MKNKSNPLNTFIEFSMWMEAIASCAIENDPYAVRMMKLRKSDDPKDKAEFAKEFQKFMMDEREERGMV